MVKSIKFKPVLINSELRETYTWIELRNQIEQNLKTKKLFDQWNKKTVLKLITPYLKEINTNAIQEKLDIIFEQIRDNDEIIVIEDDLTQKIILAIIEYLYQDNFDKNVTSKKIE
ncbi:unnamed protein product [marine sediment metagenome]|uniref:Uncharacterized protein n=1 Tax=marine sediment metagenome TaxID=412755 RepID=X1EF76_9ZZZZ